MPDLSDLFDRNLLNVSLDVLFGGNSRMPGAHPELPMFITLVRLSDKALREYEGARTEFATWRSTPSNVMSPFFRGIDHLENVVTSTHRGALLSARLRDAGWGRSASVATPTQLNSLRLLRNRIEHVDDRLAKGQIKTGQPYTVTPRQHRVELGEIRLTYRDMASCIRKNYNHIEAIRGPSTQLAKL